MRIAHMGALLSVVSIGCGAGTPRPAPPRAAPAAEVEPPPGHLLDDVRQVSAGTTHTCALRDGGAVWCWGDNALGQLGDGTRVTSHLPVQVRSLPPARSVDAGAHSTCATTLDGDVYCWGANSVGQLGDGRVASGDPTPTRVPRLTGAQRTAGSDFSERHCAIGEQGALACWGRLGIHGADGRPLLGSREPEPEPFEHDAVAVAIGAGHECVLSGAGEVFCRGLGGALGHASTGLQTHFTRVAGLDRVVSIAAGARHTCAVRTDGSAWCWGANEHGQLGNGGRAPFTAPTRVSLPVAVRAIVAGHTHTCALGEHGNVYCWGDNTRRQVGALPGRPAQADSPQVVRLRAKVQELAAGARHTCALLQSGEVQCWGDNLGGQLGDGTAEGREWPVAVLRGSRPPARVAQVSADDRPPSRSMVRAR